MSGCVTFRPLGEDHVAVARGSFWHPLKRRRFHVRLLILTAFGAMLGAAIDWLDGAEAIFAWLVFGASAALLWIVMVLTGVYLLIPRRAGRLARQQRSLDQSFSIRWTDDELETVSENSRSRVPWRDYHLWFETPSIFAFGLNEKLFHMAPKRVMSTAEIDDLRRTCTAAMGVAGRPPAT